MSIQVKKRSRKGCPSRSISPESFYPGIFLRIGTTQCSVIRDDLTSSEFSIKTQKSRDYGFQVSFSQPIIALSQPSDPLSSPPEHTISGIIQENKKTTRRSASIGERCCASCGATKTPYWRDAWGENISLCNACGLRYAKFKKRCSSCHYVPRKEDKNGRACSQCRGSWL